MGEPNNPTDGEQTDTMKSNNPTDGEQTDTMKSNNPTRRRRRRIIVLAALIAALIAMVLAFAVPALVRGGSHHGGRGAAAYMSQEDRTVVRERLVEVWEERAIETLAPLVDGGTLSESQRDAVIETLLEARETVPDSPMQYRFGDSHGRGRR